MHIHTSSSDSRLDSRRRRTQRYYKEILKNLYRFFVPPNVRVLALGSSSADLLAELKPSSGLSVELCPRSRNRTRDLDNYRRDVKADAADYSSQRPFDYIIACDLVNIMPDVHATLTHARAASHSGTRIVLNYFNIWWLPIFSICRGFGIKLVSHSLTWLSKADLMNLLDLAGWEVVKTDERILCPLPIPIFSGVVNRWIAPLPIIRRCCLTFFVVARPKPVVASDRDFTCTVVIPAMNESGNIEAVIRRTAELGKGTELILINGNSTDDTWEVIQAMKQRYSHRNIVAIQQTTQGKGGACREALAKATGEIIFILDADLTTPPEELPKFYEAIRIGQADFVNGVRFVYSMEKGAMRFLNIIGNRFFSRVFTWLLGQRIRDTLCGTKVLSRENYQQIAADEEGFGDVDPFGDFALILGALKMNLKIQDLPVRYCARTYGKTNINRWRDGMILLRLTICAAFHLKFTKLP